MRKRIIAIGALLGLGVSLLILAQSSNELFNQARALEADGKYEEPSALSADHPEFSGGQTAHGSDTDPIGWMLRTAG